MIRVRNLTKTYPVRGGQRTILDAISFDLEKGRKLGILGRNGAGKSTLVRLISGAERPNSGTIERTMSVSWPLAFSGAFQSALTGQDNVRFISRIYNSDFERNIAAVDEFAELGRYFDDHRIRLFPDRRNQRSWRRPLCPEMPGGAVRKTRRPGHDHCQPRCSLCSRPLRPFRRLGCRTPALS
jgi:ABC-type Na+ transport system ATPase subunit NatA